DLNPQPADYKSAALPIELRQRNERDILIASQLNINYFFTHRRCLIAAKQKDPVLDSRKPEQPSRQPIAGFR
ncbi:MAG: hypothetical protein P1P81_03665, partial [Desulfobulbales bacterium]|nr:hypothetical protein [Desulfobulbales bacterium]